MKTKRNYFLVVFIVLGLSIFGCIMVYSASCYSANYHYGNDAFFLYKQIFGVVLGFALMIALSFFDYHKLKKFKWWLVLITVILLVLVFIPGIGVENYGAKRWVSIFGISIQPSEIAKFALIIFASAYLSENHDKIKTLKGLLPVVFVALVFCALVMLEPSMSVTMCLAFTTLFLLIIGGISKKHTIMFSIDDIGNKFFIIIIHLILIKYFFCFFT